MPGKLTTVFFVCLWLSSLLTAAPAAASGEIVVYNQTDKAARLAFVYWHPSYNQWVLDAWFRVGPDSGLRVKKPVGSTLYWYAEAWVAGKLYYWPSPGSQDKFWTVVNSKMFGEADAEINDKNSRRVGFDRVKGAEGCQKDCRYTITLK